MFKKSEKGTEFEDGYDSGTVARSETLFSIVGDLLVSIDWSRSDVSRCVHPGESRPSPILKSFSFRNRPRPRPRPRLPSAPIA